MNIVHPDDAEFVEHLTHLGPKQGMWIAGGAPLSWYRGEPTTSDIDLFFEDAASYQRMLDSLVRYHDEQVKVFGSLSSVFPFSAQPKPRKGGNLSVSMSKLMETKNAVTFEAHATKRDTEGVKRYLVQLIRRRWYPTVDELLEDFDITVCQIATDTARVVTGRHFAEDVANRRLRLHNITPSTAKRVVKYWIYGYQPDDAVLERVLSDDTQTLEVSSDDY